MLHFDLVRAGAAAWLGVFGLGLGCSFDSSSEGEPSAGEGSSSSGAPASESGSDSSDSGDPVGPGGPWEHGYAIPFAEQVPGDPEAGYWALLNEGYVSCGIPYPLFGLAQGALGSFASEPPLPGREGKNAEVPYNWTVHVAPSGAEIVSLNCLECHAGRFNGELIVGLGRADVDYTSSPGGGLEQIPIPDLPIPGLDELARLAERYEVLGPRIEMYTVGTNPADMLAAILAAHRDPQTLEWFDEPSWQVPEVVGPVDTPPWWRVKKKSGLFYNGMARGDHRSTMMFASSLCTDSVEEMQSILAYFNNIRAYLTTIEAPAYPFAIDEGLAAQGEPIFAANCAGCHGTYAASDDDEAYPNLLLPLDVIGTDPLIAQSVNAFPQFTDWYNASPYGQVGELTAADPFLGYNAPPLDGIWATAPFLHNASVPTLELVLDSTKRPTYWKRIDYDSTHFDEHALGWPYVEMEYGQDGAPPEQAKFIYDTTLVGHSAVGHTFGDHLTEAERTALLEYLKTI